MSVQDTSLFENDLKFVEAASSGLKNQSLQGSVEAFRDSVGRSPRFSYTNGTKEHASKNQQFPLRMDWQCILVWFVPFGY